MDPFNEEPWKISDYSHQNISNDYEFSYDGGENFNEITSESKINEVGYNLPGENEYPKTQLSPELNRWEYTHQFGPFSSAEVPYFTDNRSSLPKSGEFGRFPIPFAQHRLMNLQTNEPQEYDFHYPDIPIHSSHMNPEQSVGQHVPLGSYTGSIDLTNFPPSTHHEYGPHNPVTYEPNPVYMPMPRLEYSNTYENTVTIDTTSQWSASGPSCYSGFTIVPSYNPGLPSYVYPGNMQVRPTPTCSLPPHPPPPPQSGSLIDARPNIAHCEMISHNRPPARVEQTPNTLNSEERRAILKEWFEKHKIYPYPSDTEKQLLSQMTGLSITQITNWFYNTRKRRKKDNKMTWVPRIFNWERSFNFSNVVSQEDMERNNPTNLNAGGDEHISSDYNDPHFTHSSASFPPKNYDSLFSYQHK